jgi:hypothetical protein
MTPPDKEIIPIAYSRERPSRTRIIAARQGKLRHNSELLETELRYMDAGERGPKRHRWAKGTPGYHSHVIRHDIDHRYALAARDEANHR